KPVMRALENAFTSSVPVLIHGESGTGKELAARAIHNQGPRKDFPFVAMNCAGIPEALLEAELFGHERGAFTGAVSRRLGVFEQAQGGTLFLDEIGDLHPSLQAKLLRVLQSKQFKRVGGNSTLTADVRVLAATNRDLEQEVEEGRFRPDLYYRLAVYTVLLPPLRDRAGDVPYLVVYFLTRCADRENKEIVGADPEVLELLELHDYPGNVRELENIISYAVVSARDEVLSIADLPPGFLRAVARKQKLVDADRGTATPADEDTGEGPFATLAAHEKKHIANALLRARGNKTRAAHMLGVSRMRLYRKIAEYGLEDSQEDPAQPAESEDA
ncbi:MAG: two-component system response regulator AtoC, partial [Myxococcota bacterium]